MDEVFEHRDMSAAVFNDVNLHKVTFRNVNLSGATIRDANLSNVSIDEANIAGLTIFGFDVEALIEDERDRRDPERRRLRARDLGDPDSVREMMDNLESLRAQFRRRLEAAAPPALVARPAPAKWSAIEHVRHLLFAEDLYINRWILRNDRPWNQLGLLPTFLAHDPAYADVGRQPSDDLETILAAWDDVHAVTRAFLADLTPEKLRGDTSDVDFGQGTVGQVLQGMARHDLHHIRRAKEALQKQMGT